MQVIHETRPEFRCLQPSEIMKRLLHDVKAGPFGQVLHVGQSLSRQTANRGYDLADFRPYAPGDDTRFLDWMALARLDQPVVRLFESTNENPQLLLVDASKSMDYGAPSKFSAACWAVMEAAVQCWKHGYRFGVDAMTGDGLQSIQKNERIREPEKLIHLIRALAAIEPDGVIEMDRALAIGAARQSGARVMTIISDFLPNAPTLPKRCNRRVNLVRVLSQTEIDPVPILINELVDMETGKKIFARHDENSIQAYREALRHHGSSIARLALSTGGFALDVRT